jgi:hypothetical protein
MLANYGARGIQLEIDGAEPLIANNYVYNSGGSGIHADGTTISNVSVVGNYVLDAGSFGIEANDIRDSLFTGNYVRGSTAHGYRNPNTVTANNALIGNHFQQNRQTGGGAVIEAADGTLVMGNIFGGQNANTCAFEKSGNNAEYYHNLDVSGVGFNINNGSILNGEVLESANAESPQGSYPAGTLVRFTDSGDGSGTGTYLVTRGGGTIQVSSSA